MGTHAQQATPAAQEQAQATQTVVITGIRRSLETSIELKRNAAGLVDGIVAEDIGKFPDTNLAESLGRISGVSIDRNSSGEGTRITVRGMGPDQNLVLLNGRQMPGSSLGGAPSSRSFDFSNLSTDGVAALEVYKTSRASSPTGGMGATVNIRSPRPFDFKETVAQVGVKLVNDESARNVPLEEQGKALTPELSGIYSTVSKDGTFGITLMGTYQVRDSGFSTASIGNGWKSFPGTADDNWGAGTAAWGALPAASTTIVNRPSPDTSVYSVPQNMNYSFTGVHRERLNGQAVIQVKPMKDVVATLDFVMSEQKFKQRRNDINGWFNYVNQFGEYTTGTPSSPIIYGENVVNQDLAMGTSLEQVKNQNQQIGLNVKWKASDALSFDFDVHHSEAKSGSDNPALGTGVVLAFASFNRQATSVDFSKDFPVLMIDGATIDPALMELQGSSFSNSYQKNVIDQAQAKGRWDIDADSSLDFGLALTTVDNRSAFKNVQRDTWGANVAGGPAAMPDDFWRADTVSRYFSNIPGSSDPRLFNQRFGFKFEDAHAAAVNILGSDELLRASYDWADDFRTKEESTSIFAQYNRSFTAGVPMDVSMGVRYERTKVVSPSIEQIPVEVRWVGQNEFPITFSGTQTSSRSGQYSYVLPSIDWSADIGSKTKLRASYGKTIGRPGWAAIQGGRTLTPTAYLGGASGTVGEPGLRPLQSTNIDLSAEHYYAKGSYVAASYFTKSIKDYNSAVVVDQYIEGLTTPAGGAYFNQAVAAGCGPAESECIRNWIFANLPNAPGVDVANQVITGQPGDPLLRFAIGTIANNDKKSKINGFELNVQHMFGNTGFGVSANFTKVKSDRTYDVTNPVAQTDVLTGMGDSGNLVGFFENSTFNVRVAYNWRGEYLAGNVGGVDYQRPIFVAPYGQVDLSMGYNVNDNLRLQFEAINLTDEYTRTYSRSESQVNAVTQLGRRFMIGARYKF
jgi:TonB-dependent receptor